MQVLRQAVAHVHHGADASLPREPGALGEARGELKMVPAAQTAPELAGDVNPVAHARAGPGDDPRTGGLAEEGEAGRDDAIGLGEVAADDGHPVLAGARGETAVEQLEPLPVHAGVEGEREHGGGRSSAHGGEVAEVALEEFCPDGARRHGVVEMPAVNDRVHRDELPAARRGQHGAVVTDAERRARRCGP